jgi:hypothetical protein
MQSLKPAIIMLILAPFLSATPILAQSGGDLPRLGIGTELNNYYSVYFPISIAPRLRLEPSIRVNIVAEEEMGATYDRSTLDFGAGLFLLSSRDGNNLYIGARIWNTHYRFIRIPFQGDKYKHQRNGFFLAPTIGGEYFLSPRFSLGAEVQLGYTLETIKSNDNKQDRSAIQSLGNILVRFYFP